jgi:hypothetical protein
MFKLEDTQIDRGGVTASQLVHETTECSFSVDSDGEAISLHFHLASKGGGTTEVRVTIGSKGISSIVREFAENVPQSAGFIVNAAALATTRLRLALARGQIALHENRAHVNAAVHELEALEELVQEAYNSAPEGSDEREKTALLKLRSALTELRAHEVPT